MKTVRLEVGRQYRPRPEFATEWWMFLGYERYLGQLTAVLVADDGHRIYPLPENVGAFIIHD